MVKDYVTKRLKLEQEEIAEDERLIAQYRQETEKMRTQIEQLKSRLVHVYNSNGVLVELLVWWLYIHLYLFEITIQ